MKFSHLSSSSKGINLLFIILIITGYITGITLKIINGQYNYILAMHFLNNVIVMTNMFVYIKNKALDIKS